MRTIPVCIFPSTKNTQRMKTHALGLGENKTKQNPLGIETHKYITTKRKVFYPEKLKAQKHTNSKECYSHYYVSKIMKITFYHKNVSEAEDLWTKILTLTLISFHLSFGYMFYYLKNYLKKTVYGVSFFSCFCFLLQCQMTGVPFLQV